MQELQSVESNLHRVQTKIPYRLATEQLKKQKIKTDMDLIKLLVNHLLDP